MTANDKCWKKLFYKYDIIAKVNKNQFFDITANQIKEFREPRLMCKMDFKQSVAKPFKDNEFSILAIKNGVYRIAKTSPFFDIDLEHINNTPVIDFELPEFLETLNFDNITSESQALDAAVASGILKNLLGENSYLTVRGRRYSSDIQIKIKTIEYPISSVQIEVDGGYEGKTSLALIEAKMGTTDNMNMRQLIYPHKHFENTIKKPVKTYVMFYETGSIFTFIPMSVKKNECNLNYHAARRFRLIKTIKPETSKLDLVLPLPGHGAPFPQADDFNKVLYGYLNVGKSSGTEEEIFSALPIVPRQYNYYFNAMKWLGLVEKEGRGKPIYLSDFGEDLLKISEKQRLLILRKVILKNEVVKHIQRNPNQPISETLKQENGLIGKSMYSRRKKTIQAWLSYFSERLS